eukprot:639805-Pyramimonas_sp.AAC.1
MPRRDPMDIRSRGCPLRGAASQRPPMSTVSLPKCPGCEAVDADVSPEDSLNTAAYFCSRRALCSCGALSRARGPRHKLEITSTWTSR